VTEQNIITITTSDSIVDARGNIQPGQSCVGAHGFSSRGVGVIVYTPGLHARVTGIDTLVKHYVKKIYTSR
jgi:hypothetical protein